MNQIIVDLDRRPSSQFWPVALIQCLTTSPKLGQQLAGDANFAPLTKLAQMLANVGRICPSWAICCSKLPNYDQKVGKFRQCLATPRFRPNFQQGNTRLPLAPSRGRTLSRRACRPARAATPGTRAPWRAKFLRFTCKFDQARANLAFSGAPSATFRRNRPNLGLRIRPRLSDIDHTETGGSPRSGPEIGRYRCRSGGTSPRFGRCRPRLAPRSPRNWRHQSQI